MLEMTEKNNNPCFVVCAEGLREGEYDEKRRRRVEGGGKRRRGRRGRRRRKVFDGDTRVRERKKRKEK